MIDFTCLETNFWTLYLLYFGAFAGNGGFLCKFQYKAMTQKNIKYVEVLCNRGRHSYNILACEAMIDDVETNLSLENRRMFQRPMHDY